MGDSRRGKTVPEAEKRTAVEGTAAVYELGMNALTLAGHLHYRCRRVEYYQAPNRRANPQEKTSTPTRVSRKGRTPARYRSIGPQCGRRDASNWTRDGSDRPEKRPGLDRAKLIEQNTGGYPA